MHGLARVLSRGRAAHVALVALALLAAVPSGAARRTPTRRPAPAPARTDSVAAAWPQIVVLAYHEIGPEPGQPLQTVSPEFLQAQIRSCRAQGWTFLSLTELITARDHGTALPPRVMVLTFDDGYQSFADRALPILRAEHVRATLAPITSYVGQEHPELGALLDWAQLRALDQAGVDIASHSHALHQFEMNDPQRDTAPSVSARRWRPETASYESREDYRSRLWADFTESQRTLTRELGHPANVLVWPYGVYNEMARVQAAVAGFTVSLTLEPRFVTRDDLSRGVLPRVMVTRRMDFADAKLSWMHEDEGPVRAAEIDLDALWDPDEMVFRTRLDQAVTRARAMGATEVVLPFAPDPRRDGQMRRAYAMNHQIPLLADLWTMAASKFIAAQMRVWVRVPTLNQTWTWERRPEWRVTPTPGEALADRWTTRLSPERTEVRQTAADLLADLAVYLPISGVLFDSDLAVGAREGLASDTTHTPAPRVAALRAVADSCERAVRAWRPQCRFARVLPAQTIERVGIDAATSSDLDESFRAGELVVIDGTTFADPTPESFERFARQARTRWLRAGHAGDAPVLLMIPARRADGAWIPAARQQALATAALRGGLVHLGSSPVQAQGELPLGLLDARPALPATRAATQRR